MTKAKACNKCGQEKPLTSEYWHKNKYRKDGFQGECKVCRNNANKLYRLENKEYYNSWRKNNKGYFDKYQKENKEKISQQKSAYYKKNKEVLGSYYKQWYKENKEICKSNNRRYYQENKNKANIRLQKRLAKKKKLPATLTLEQWIRAKQDFNNQCAYCGKSEEKHLKEFGEELHQEHFIPLKENGEYTHNNIIPACKSCNSSKRDKDFFEWYPKQEFYSNEREQFILDYLNYKNENMQQLSIL